MCDQPRVYASKSAGRQLQLSPAFFVSAALGRPFVAASQAASPACDARKSRGAVVIRRLPATFTVSSF
jgi:hypothetical protein